MSASLIPRYTHAVLEFDMKNDDADVDAPSSQAADVDAFVERTYRLFQKAGSTFLILFGVGAGATASALRTALPASARLVVCETDTAAARAFLDAHPEWREDGARATLVADISLWAHFYLLALSGASVENSSTALNPELDDAARPRYQALQRLFLQARPHQAINSSYLSHVAVQAPDLTAAAILSPDEPELDSYFSQFPDWIKEVVVLWDGETPPERELRCAAPIRHHAHPLDDFASQRNRMLDLCESDWVLYLDGDETFSEDVWSLFPALMLIKRLEGCYFPRLTFYPDDSCCKVGYGMWPDLQLRLFRKTADVRFERPVHEKVTGIDGRVALALDAPILHHSRLRKTPDELAAKLRRFDAAADDAIHHVLNDDYPHLDRDHFAQASLVSGALQVLLLEENPV